MSFIVLERPGRKVCCSKVTEGESQSKRKAMRKSRNLVSLAKCPLPLYQQTLHTCTRGHVHTHSFHTHIHTPPYIDGLNSLYFKFYLLIYF